MTVAKTLSVSINATQGELVQLEGYMSNSLPRIVLVGLPDTSINEAAERIRAAAATTGYPFPARKITINLTPAELPKHGSGFDLALALVALASFGVISAEKIAQVVHIGEIGLDGSLHRSSGVLPAVLAAQKSGIRTVMVPRENYSEAKLVSELDPGLEIIPVDCLAQALLHYGAELNDVALEQLEKYSVPKLSDSALREEQSELDNLSGLATIPDEKSVDFSEVIGNPEAVEAALIAAAGGHHLLMVGAPGSGKTMIASRLPGILPRLSQEQALEVAVIKSITAKEQLSELPTVSPFVAPHHTITQAAMIGGGSRIKPGAVAQAHLGVLFLDEATEFPRAILDCLRQPLESGTVTIHRARAASIFPAKFQLVLACNPCPCGNFYGGTAECSCTSLQRRRYFSRLSGPLLDRVDLRVQLRRVSSAAIKLHQSQENATTAELRERVLQARAIAKTRLNQLNLQNNSQLPGSWLRGEGRLPNSVTSGLDRALELGNLTMRGYDRVLRLAWTISDLTGQEQPGVDELSKALYYREVAA